MARSFSIEDGNLGSSILVTRGTRVYRDIDLLFTTNNVGDVYKKKDAAAVKQSVKNIIMTSFGEKPFEPNYGTDLSNLLFENFDPDIESKVALSVKLAIQAWEPRAKVESVKVKALEEQNALYLTLNFYVVNVEELITLNVTLSRLR